MIRIGKKIKYAQHRKRIGAYVIIEHDTENKIAIATDKPNAYFLLGGGTEKKESTEEALKREVLEETGYSLNNIKLFDKISSWYYSEKYG